MRAATQPDHARISNKLPPEPGEADRSGQAHRSTGPLIWLLLLIGAVAALWYIYGRPDQATAPPPLDSATPVVAPQADTSADAVDTDTGEGPSPPEAMNAPATPASPPVPADRSARPSLQVPPAYPPAALRVREEGTVLLRVEVDSHGHPAEVSIERSSRSRELDRAAREAVSQWTFEPAIEDGRPVASSVTVPVDFRIGDQ